MKSRPKKDNPLVSVIIPCYNYGDFLQQCVESATGQTYKNTEIIIINDGSTDNTAAVAKKLQVVHKNIRYIEQENQGIIATRNKGIDLAKGDYLIQLDADDRIDLNYIENTLEVAATNKLDIVYTQVKVFGRVNFTSKYPEFNLEYLKHDNYIHASALVKKEVFKNHRYDSYLNDKWYEDWDLFLNACLNGARAGLCTGTLLHYRKHSRSDSRSDDYDNKFKELLVRHHILSKQNSKHPDAMWYFSSYITILKKYIDDYGVTNELRTSLATRERELAHAKQQLGRYMNFPPIRLARKFNKIVNKFKRT